jgi:hypothetical protein
LIADCGLRIADCGLGIAEYLIADCGLKREIGNRQTAISKFDLFSLGVLEE